MAFANYQKQTEDTLLTFTIHDEQYIKANQYDDAWVLSAERASNCKYLVCCHSQEPQKGTAFCVGLVSQIQAKNPGDGKTRYAICISAYAPIDLPDVWDGGQNPVRYVSLQDLGIDPASLTFETL
ncbi:hypothetical protein PN441_13225 [Spirulina major CS-329]|uniref:hypothetical protein n=1 Tax=Spirulina TaxID=1154 RepID=UPI00232EDE31|nr:MULTISPECIES: hypothetical protein [Spirulina]MDB9493382.1 hypothetical protein [Spirulina subsalsa CS-330]MDB9504031.1 hypothetical protein [Spirulina major CS-329]